MDKEKIRQFAEDSIGIINKTGVKLESVEPGHVCMSVPLSPDNVNHFQTMYAGAQFTLAEVMGGALMMATFDTSKYIPIVGKYEIVFTKPARTKLTAELSLSESEIAAINAQLDSENKANFVTNTELKDEQGDVCAVGTAKYYLVAAADLK